MRKCESRFKVLLGAFMVCLGILGSVYPGGQSQAAEWTGKELGTQVKKQDADLREIPDKYNTGTVGELEKVTSECMISGVKFRGSEESDRKLDLYYQSVEIPKEIVVENYDFSSSKFSIQHADKLEYDVNIVFRNCKFKSVIIYSGKHANCQFENCTFTHFSGSNATFNNCYFGSGTDGDGINPGENCTFTNCMIADLIHPADEVHDNHVDGFQIFGSTEGDNVNIHLNNCRFEVPNIPFSKPSGAMNCPITITMRYSNADDISFENCYVNGGVYYAMGLSQIEQKITNLSVENVHLGGNSKSMYVCDMPEYDDMLKQNVTLTDALYVSSVRRLDDGVHLSVTNDTRIERKLAIVTDQGVQQTFLIPACPYGREIEEDTMTYQDFPFDLDVKIPDADWVVCYDITDTVDQIRFVNWSENDVYLDADTLEFMSPVRYGEEVTSNPQPKDEGLDEKNADTYKANDKEDMTEGIGEIGEIGERKEESGKIIEIQDVSKSEAETQEESGKMVETQGVSKRETEPQEESDKRAEIQGVSKGGTERQDESGKIAKDQSDSGAPEKQSGVDAKIGSGDNLTETAGNATDYQIAATDGIKVGDTFIVKKAKYKVTCVTEDSLTVAYVKNTNKKVKRVSIPKKVSYQNKTFKVTEIAANAFYKNTGLQNVTIGSNVKTIGKNAFYGCRKLKKITIGKNVKKIGKKAFYGCTNLKTIKIKTKKLNRKTVGSLENLIF